MSSSTSNLDLLVPGQAGKEVTVNALADSASPAMIFGRRAYASYGLVWGYYGGTLLVDGTLTTIPNGALAPFPANQTNYVQATRAGVVSSNTSGYTAGQIPLYIVVTGTSTVTSYVDNRALVLTLGVTGLKSIALSDVNTTLSAAQASNQILEFTGTLTAQRNIVVPLAPRKWTVYNGTTQALQIIGASGTGVVIATTKTADVYSNGTNVRRATADV